MLLSINFKKNIIYLLLGLILLVHALILTKLIYFPYPEFFIYPYLTNHGLKPYSEILDQHFPGLMFMPINLDNLGMNTPEVARIWTIVIVLVTHILLFLIADKLFKSKIKAFLVNILFLIWQPFFEGWVLWIDSFLPLLLLPAFYFLYKRHLFVTGLLLGFSIVFKQTVIPLSVIVLIYIFWTTRNFTSSLMYLCGLLIPVSLMVAYFISIGVFGDFWYWTVTFNLTIYREFGRGVSPTLAHFSRVGFVFGFAFILLIFNGLRKIETLILLIFLLGALFGLSTRFDFVHFQPALPFALLATVCGLIRLKGIRKLLVMSFYGLITLWWLVTFYKGYIGNRVISFDANSKNLVSKIKDLTDPGDRIFVLGAAPHLYQMTETLPAGNIFVFQFPWFLKVAEGRILEGIKKDKPEIIISDREVRIEEVKITDFAGDIDKFINQYYQKIDSVGTADILRRK